MISWITSKLHAVGKFPLCIVCSKVDLFAHFFRFFFFSFFFSVPVLSHVCALLLYSGNKLTNCVNVPVAKLESIAAIAQISTEFETVIVNRSLNGRLNAFLATITATKKKAIKNRTKCAVCAVTICLCDGCTCVLQINCSLNLFLTRKAIAANRMIEKRQTILFVDIIAFHQQKNNYKIV